MIKDLLDCRFGKLLVVFRTDKHPKTGRACWITLCDCGNLSVMDHYNIQHNTRCRECGSKSRLKHGHAGNGNRRSAEHQAWMHMKQRCLNIKDQYYSYYGGRGITICERWKSSFPNFLKDMGFRPSPELSLDRIDVDKGYYPSNCRWTTKSEQTRNRRKTRAIQNFSLEELTVELNRRSSEFGISGC